MKLSYKVEKFTVDRKNVDRLKLLRYHRNIVPSQVNRIYKSLKEGVNFDSPLVVNKIGDNYHLIDGGHRKEAIVKYVKDGNSVEILFATYQNLTEEEEKTLFAKWNMGRRQSSNDYVKIYADEIPILKMMEKDFPAKIKIYNLAKSELGIHFTPLINAYLTAKNSSDRLIVYSRTAAQLVKDAKKLTEDDYLELKEFAKWFIAVFGNMSGDNRYQTTTGLNVFATIFFDNREGNGDLKRRFIKKVFGDSNVMAQAGAGGIVGTKLLYITVINLLKDGRSRQLTTRVID